MMVFTRLLLPLLFTALLLVSCGGKQPAPEQVTNPYIARATDYIKNGMVAMQKERWSSAERAFSRALLAAQLADDIRLTTLAWYNLGAIHAAMGNADQAEKAYQRSIDLSGRYSDEIMQIRAHLALWLMQSRNQTLPDHFSLDDLPPTLLSATGWPADIHLQAARLAQRLNRAETAKSSYLSAISLLREQRGDLKMKAQAYMGLAQLAQTSGDENSAWTQIEKTLVYCRKVGAPRLTAHALLFQGRLAASHQTVAIRHDKLDRALDIYVALADLKGQKESLSALVELAKSMANHQILESLQLRLMQVEDKLREDQK